MTINVTDIENMEPELKAELLRELIKGSYLWWFKDTLRSLNVPQRTNHYKAFSWSTTMHSTQFNTREENKLIACTRILASTTLSDWLNAYLQHWSIKGFVERLRGVIGREDLPIEITVN